MTDFAALTRSPTADISLVDRTPTLHNLTVELGADNEDGTHEVKVSYDGHVALHVRLTRGDVDRLSQQLSAVVGGMAARDYLRRRT